MLKPEARRGRPAVSEADYAHLAAFRQALREFLHFSENEARSAGMHPQQHQALLLVRGFPGPGPISVGDLAASLRIRHHSAVGLITRMEANGLVLKSGDSADRRRVRVRLTARGRRVLERLSAAHKNELMRVGPALEQILARLRVLA